MRLGHLEREIGTWLSHILFQDGFFIPSHFIPTHPSHPTLRWSCRRFPRAVSTAVTVMWPTALMVFTGLAYDVIDQAILRRRQQEYIEWCTDRKRPNGGLPPKTAERFFTEQEGWVATKHSGICLIHHERGNTYNPRLGKEGVVISGLTCVCSKYPHREEYVGRLPRRPPASAMSVYSGTGNLIHVDDLRKDQLRAHFDAYMQYVRNFKWSVMVPLGEMQMKTDDTLVP